MKRSLILTTLAVVVALACATGCARKDPMERVVKASTRQEFERWKGQISTELSPASAKDLDLAVQEIKILVMAQKGRGGSDLLDEGMRVLIQGKPTRHAIRLGIQARRDRLEMERGEVRARLAHDGSLKTREGDTEAAAYLDRIKKAEADRLQALTEEIDNLDEKLKRLESPGQ